MMVRSRVKTTLVDLDSILPLLPRQRETTGLIGSKTNKCHSSKLKLGQECFRSLCRLLDEHIYQLYKVTTSAQHMKMIFPTSAYISVIISPALESTGDGDAKTFHGLNLGLLQKPVVEERLYVSRKGRFGTIVIIQRALETSQGSRNIQYRWCLAMVRRLVNAIDSAPRQSCYCSPEHPRCADCNQRLKTSYALFNGTRF